MIGAKCVNGRFGKPMRSLLVVVWCGGQVLTSTLWCILGLGLEVSVLVHHFKL